MDLRYENHIHEDMKYPIIFNRVAFPRHTIHPGANWHENLELMHLVAGNGAFLLGQSHVYAEAGDTLVINTNELHTIYSTEQGCVYYYLVADTCLCAELDISVSDSLFAPRIRDPFVTEQFARMIREREQQEYTVAGVPSKQSFRGFWSIYTVTTALSGRRRQAWRKTGSWAWSSRRFPTCRSTIWKR